MKHKIRYAWNRYPVFTIVLVASNIIIYLLCEIFGSTLNTSFMIDAGASFGPYIFEEHEYFRLFSCMFLHFGSSHLVSNMLSLAVMGNELELSIGHFSFLATYLVSGLGASLISSYAYYTMNDPVVSAGASGAIMGIAGALIVYLVANKSRFDHSRGLRLLIVVVLMLHNGMNSTQIDNYAHMGGLAVGGLIMVILLFFKNTKKEKKTTYYY